MDLNIKGKTWVGNIYHKFEAMCYEVDDFVSQDTVKYVGNQVQTVGKSVKRFYSDVVQDLLPPSLVDPVNDEAQTIGTYSNSMIDIEEKSVDIDIKQSSMKQEPIDPLKNCHSLSCTGHPILKYFIPPPTEDPFKGPESDLSLGQDCDAFIYEKMNVGVEGNANSDMGVEENVLIEERSPSEDLTSSEDKNLFETSSFSESVDENQKSEILDKCSPAAFVVSVESRSTAKEGKLFNSFLNEGGCVSNISSSLRCSELSFSIISIGNKVAETTLISSSISASTESFNLSEVSRANFPNKAENIICDPTDSVGSVSDISGALSSSEYFAVASDNKDMDLGLAFPGSGLSMESNDANTSRTYQAVSVAGSSGYRPEHDCKSDQLKNFMSSLESGELNGSSIGTADPSMETIDLSDKLTLNDSCIIMDSKSLYPLSCSTRKLRSYKKIFQDAFASRKRLAKEYEQLAIWHGDIDVEFSHQPDQNMLPSIATMSLEANKLANQDLSDFEWELL